MSGGRQWAMTLDVECRVETCSERDTASVVAVGAEDARQGAMKVLRYRGWTLDRRDDLCPAHSGPIRVCDLCGTETPKPYGYDARMRHIHGASWVCHRCYQKAFDARMRERFLADASQEAP